jgi:hypothetical protein
MSNEKRIVFFTYPPLIYTWPIIAMGIIFWPLALLGVSSTALGWIYTTICTFVLVAMGVDLDRTKTFMWGLAASVIFLLITLAGYNNIPVASHILSFLGLIAPEYSYKFGLVMSIFLGIGFILMIIGTRVNDRWVVTHNEFEHISLGRVDDSLARGAKTIRTSYPDLLESMLCLSGSLLIYDSLGKRLLRKIDHVPFLPFLRSRMAHFLEVTAVTDNTLIEQIETECLEDDIPDADDEQLEL